MNTSRKLGLFDATGIELEYMIVDSSSLSVRALADQVLSTQAGETVMSVEVGDIAWSNELALHVIELKTNGPTRDLAGAAISFHQNIQRIDEILAPLQARLMPTAMHPWMDPETELVMWPHEDDEIYAAFHRIFDCRGHGWANLQSMHINLPFDGDEEFSRLHAAIRLVLPILPALAASSPVVEGEITGLCDSRLDVYRGNARRVPSVSGRVIPERVFTRDEYEGVLLARVYHDLEPHDPEGILRYEWVNARGAIARFDRDAIEIRVLDVQECPRADLAVAAAVIAVLRGLVEERRSSAAEQRRWHEDELVPLLDETIRDGDRAVLRDQDYLSALGVEVSSPCAASEVWRHLIDSACREDPVLRQFLPELDVILDQGCLSRRITSRLGESPDRGVLAAVYEDLCDCLRHGRMFRVDV